MSNKSQLRATTPQADIQRIRRLLRKLRSRRNAMIESRRELRFPGDIPNPLRPYRAHRRSGMAPLSHSERVTFEQASLYAEEPFDAEDDE